MKKLVSLLLVCVMLVAFAVPAFADEGGSIRVTPPTVESAKQEDGTDVKSSIKVEECKDLNMQETVQGAIEASDVDPSEVVASEVFEIYKDSNKDQFEQLDSPYTVVIVRQNKTGEIAAIMCEKSAGEWEPVKSFRDLGDGRVEITFEHFCTVVMLIKDPTPPPAKKPTTTSTSSGPKSPKTGYD